MLLTWARSTPIRSATASLTEPGRQPPAAHIATKHTADIHPQDGCQSRILLLRIIIRGSGRRMAKSPDSITRETTLKVTPNGPAEALIGPRATIIVVFLVRAGRSSEVIMDDHRPTSSGRAGTAELEAGNARRESSRGADSAENAWSPNAASRCMRARTTRRVVRLRPPAFCSSTPIAVAVSCS